MKKRCVDDALSSKVKNSNEDQSDGRSGFRSFSAHFCSKVLPSNFTIFVLSFGVQPIAKRRDVMIEKTKRFFIMLIYIKTVPGVTRVTRVLKVNTLHGFINQYYSVYFLQILHG